MLGPKRKFLVLAMYILCFFVWISFALDTQRKRVFSGIWTLHCKYVNLKTNLIQDAAFRDFTVFGIPQGAHAFLKIHLRIDNSWQGMIRATLLSSADIYSTILYIKLLIIFFSI